MESQMDQSAVNLAKAIRQIESGGNFTAKGKSGEYGAYQYMPDTWKSFSREILGKEADMTPENQNAVTYGMIKKWKDSGLNAAQIAAKWNSGSENNWEKKVGVNNYGVAYNVPEYVKKVTDQYQKFKSETPEKVENPQVEKLKNEPTLGGQIVRSLARPFFKLGGRVVQLDRALHGATEDEQTIKSDYFGDLKTSKSAKDVLGDIGTGVELAGMGLGGGGLFAGAGKSLGKKILTTAGKEALAGGVIGAGSALDQGVEEDKSAGEIAGDVVKKTLGGAAVGAVAGPIFGGVADTLGKGFTAAKRVFTETPIQTIERKATENAAKAFDISGAKTAGVAGAQPKAVVDGASVIKKYVPEFDHKVSENLSEDTLNAWRTARDKVFDTYDTIAREAGDAGIEVNLKPLVSDLQGVLDGATTGPKRARAERLLGELQTNFPTLKATPGKLQSYLKDLNEELGGLIGGAEKGASSVTKETTQKISSLLDDAINGATGKQYAAIRKEYASLKNMEKGVVRLYQKIARQKGSGLADYTDWLSNIDMIGQLFTGNIPGVARGLAGRISGSYLKALKNPEKYLRELFDNVDELSKLRSSVDIPQPIFSGKPAEPLALPAESGKPVTNAINLPQSAREENLGLNEVRNAKIANPMANTLKDIYTAPRLNPGSSGTIPGPTVRLPKSIREENLGLNELSKTVFGNRGVSSVKVPEKLNFLADSINKMNLTKEQFLAEFAKAADGQNITFREAAANVMKELQKNNISLSDFYDIVKGQ